MSLHMNMRTGVVIRRTKSQEINRLHGVGAYHPVLVVRSVSVDSRDDAVRIVRDGGLSQL